MPADSLTAGRFIAMLLLQLALIAINAFFASTELAVMTLSANKLRHQVEEGDKAAGRVLKLVENSSGFLSTIQIGITLAGFLGSAFAADNFAAPLTSWLYDGVGFTAISRGTLNTLSVIVITLVLSYLTLVFGELVPKQVALHKPYEVAKFTTGVIAGLSVVLRPVVKLLSASTALVLRLFGIKGDREENVTEDEIRMMVDAGHENGSIEADEKEMIDNVFELDKTIARDVMTHRVDVVAVEADAEPAEVVELIRDSGHSRLPVYDDSLDNILGVLNARTFLLNQRERDPQPLRVLLRPARFVPETVRADVLLKDMQREKDHLAMVLDEYGGFSGVVTMEDLIEEIVGNIYDEFDAPEETEIYQLEHNLWRIAGDTDIEDIEDALGVKLPADREYDTLGGLVFSQMSSIPNDGTPVKVDAEGLHIVTDPVEDHIVPSALVSILPPPEPEEDEEDDEGGKRENGRHRRHKDKEPEENPKKQ